MRLRGPRRPDGWKGAQMNFRRGARGFRLSVGRAQSDDLQNAARENCRFQYGGCNARRIRREGFGHRSQLEL